MTRRIRPATSHRVLVVAAHPDDEVLGCGGTIARHATAGDEVHLLVLGEGMTARGSNRDHRGGGNGGLKALRRSMQAAAKALGVIRVAAHAFPDNRFDTVALLDLIKVVEREKARIRPTIVYTHHLNDLNIDHVRTAEAVQTAFRPQPGDLCPIILAFEVPSSTEYQSPLTSAPFRPSVYVDISASLSAKCRAMAAYDTETRPYPHPRATESLKIIAQRNGIEVGLKAAERFALVRAVITQSAVSDS